MRASPSESVDSVAGRSISRANVTKCPASRRRSQPQKDRNGLLLLLPSDPQRGAGVPGLRRVRPGHSPAGDDVALVVPLVLGPLGACAGLGRPVVLRGLPAADRGHGAGSAGASGAYAASGSAGPFDDFDPFSAAKAFDVAGPGDDAAGSVDVPAPVAASQGGRAARRRKLAQWKKNKRRAVAATAVAIVGGGLTMAALPNDASPTARTPPRPRTR